MYANCRGIKGKKMSLKEIVEKVDPDIIVLNETMYQNNEETKLKAYKAFTNNRKNKKGGGIEILVRNNVQNRTVKVSEGNENIDELTVRTETKKRALNIISMYGKIEGRNSREKIKDQFTHLEELIQNIEKSGEDYILIGDLNAKIGNKENGISGNKEDINEAGRALLNLEIKTEGIIVNKTEKCKGKWTRVQHTKKNEEKSILDYVVTNQGIYEDIIEMKIDEDKIYKLTNYKRKEAVETDHNTILIDINDDRLRQKKEKQLKWMTNNKEKWKKYYSTTDSNNELDQTWRKGGQSQENWKEWEKIIHKILNETFGKFRITNNNKQGIDKEVKELLNEKREIRRKTKKAENPEEKRKFEEERKEIERQIKFRLEEKEEKKISDMTKNLSDKKNNYEVLWKMKKKIQKKQETAHIIKDKEGKDLKIPEEIKNRTSEYYKELYIPNEVKEGYENYTETLENFIEQCWKMKDEPSEELTDEEIIDTIENLEEGKATGPDGISNEMIKRGGRSLQNSIIRMMKSVYESEKIPEEWNTAYIKNIYKGKGSKKEMSNYRGIILNPHVSKIFEKIIEKKENSILQNMSEYQCGARKGKSTREHHFTIRTIIEEAKKENEEITAVYFDIMKCFDKMGLKEAMKEIWMKGIKRKHWRLIYKMNSDNKLIPLTELGMCKEIEVEEMIKQGSVLGAVISAITIDSLTRIIENHGKTWEIGGTKMNPLLFQDDIFAANKTDDMKETVKIIETFQNIKRLQFHKDKTKKSILRGKIDEPVYVNGSKIERVTSHMYLGKIIEEKGKHKEDIKERLNKANIASTISENIIREKGLNKKRIEVGVKLLQTVIVPTLISGSETWTQTTKEEENEINKVQTQFLTKLLNVPCTTPKCALLKETGQIKATHTANLRKLEFYIDLHNREETRLEVQMRIHQEKKDHKDMTYKKEIEELKKFYNITEDLKNIEAKEGKRKLKRYIIKKNEEEIEEEIRKGKKANNINEVNNEYMKKLNFKEARIIFLLKTNMIDAKANYRFQHPENQICDICEKQEETTQHLFECEGYKEIRRNIRIKSTPMETIKENNMNSLANVISKILEKRKELMEVKKNALTKENASKTSTAPLQSVALRTEDSDNDR